MDLSLDLLRGAAYALGIGLLVGVERSVRPAPDDAEPGAPEAAAAPSAPSAQAGDDPALGVRTFATLSLIGYAAAIANEGLPFVAPTVLAGLALLVLALYRQTAPTDPGITTEAAAIGTGVLGALCHRHPEAAGVLGLLLTIVLASKRFTGRAIRRMRRVEITATLQFLAVIVIVLPLLPSRPLDPWGAVNPHKIGLLVVLVSGIGYVGYVSTRVFGAERGLGLTGLLGGLTSSTAVTAAMAGESRREPRLALICAFATVVANTTSFARVLVMTAVLDPTLARRLAWSIGSMAGLALGACGVLWIAARRARTPEQGPQGEEVPLRNPFSLGPALKFGLFFVAILVAARLARTHLGEAGLYAAAAASGLADVDAITLSVAEQTRTATLELRPGAIAVTIAVVSNALVKSGIALGTGTRRFGLLVAAALVTATAAGLVVAALAPA